MARGISGINDSLGKKKIVLVGPSACGKTTFKKVFFEDANPIQLVKESLNPTRGLETDTYSAFSYLLSVWDLAGQEIDHWLGDRKDLFPDSAVIVCMMDATAPLKDSVSFLIRFLKVRRDMASSMPIFLLLTKCDLVSNIQAYNIILKIDNYVQEKYPEFADECKRTNIQRISVAEAFFLNTLTVAFRIIEVCIDKNELKVSSEYLAEIKSKMNLLSIFPPPASAVKISELSIPGQLDSSKFQKYIDDLHSLGYLVRERNVFYSLSEKGSHFINACKKQAILVKTKAMMEKISFFFGLKAEMEKIGDKV